MTEAQEDLLIALAEAVAHIAGTHHSERVRTCVCKVMAQQADRVAFDERTRKWRQEHQQGGTGPIHINLNVRSTP